VTTATTIRDAFKAIVEAHIAGVSFHSVWTPAKDEDSATLFPTCLWGAPSTQVQTINSQALRPSFLMDCLFMEQTASDRTNAERDAAHSKMDAIARQCWAKFYQTYIIASNSFQGVPMDFDPEGITVTFLPIWDDRTMQMTGVRMSARIVSGAPDICEDYFNA